ncbi:unnamed protein product [Candida verbasci]|uniref:Uncharacterized protein n=1 Tax=Candida verbasci TaxID=1227364 RepID=A0A9W4TS82_9ASCO|nr:unnamed protein product [Candida verbasci]
MEIRSRTENHLQNALYHRSDIRDTDPQHNQGDVELLAQIGYKQQLNRHYSTTRVFGIAFLIMCLLQCISSMVQMV